MTSTLNKKTQGTEVIATAENVTAVSTEHLNESIPESLTYLQKNRWSAASAVRSKQTLLPNFTIIKCDSFMTLFK